MLLYYLYHSFDYFLDLLREAAIIEMFHIFDVLYINKIHHHNIDCRWGMVKM